MDTRLFVGNLSNHTTEADLSKLFARVGTVKSVVMIKIKEPRTPRNIAFVDMGDDLEAGQAIESLNGSKLKGQVMKVDKARPREKLPSSGGWYDDPPLKTKRL